MSSNSIVCRGASREERIRKRILSRDEQQFVPRELTSLKRENETLKETRKKKEDQVRELERQYEEEADRFKKQKRSYERHMGRLKGEVEGKRNELAHIYFYEALDPVKLVVVPIVEV